MDILRDWARSKPHPLHAVFLEDDGAQAASPSHGSKPNRPQEIWYETYEFPSQHKNTSAKIDKDGPRIAGKLKSPLSQAKSLPSTSLLPFLQTPPEIRNANLVRPSLKLVKVSKEKKNNRFHFNISRDVLAGLLEAMKADPWAMWLISNQYDGFHHMRANNTYSDTFYFGCWHSALAWTFCWQSVSTRALWIKRQGISESRDWDMDREKNAISEFLSSLDFYAPLMHVPYMPAIALSLTTMLDYDARILRQLEQIEEVEEGTGFTRKHMDSGNLGYTYDVDKLTQWSRLSSGLRINITNLLRHHDNCMRLFEYIADSEKEGLSLAAGTSYTEEYDRSMADIQEMIRVLKMRADTFSTYASYIRDRAEAQVNVIFALLTHEDSVSNLKSAEASKEIAAAAKRDGSAMKTIAVMTMAFLPATFLAALFALPALEWDKPVVVKMDGLVLYWITTIILTVAVFVVWGIITQRNWFMDNVGYSRPRRGPDIQLRTS